MNNFVELPVSSKSTARRNKVHGVGINDADYIVSPIVNGKKQFCPYYLMWKRMLQRCYDPVYQARQPTYIECTVDSEWFIFSTFRRWMETQDWQGCQLDKDIIHPGNKEYSATSCCFVPAKLNSLLTMCTVEEGELPLGVHWSTKDNKYISSCNINGKLKYLGAYRSIKKASKAYIDFKVNHVRNKIDRLPIHIKYGFYKHLEIMKREYAQ